MLLVTGEGADARALEGALGGAFAITTVSSAGEALEQLRARYYALVVAEYAPPGRDGARLLAEVRGAAPWARRVLVSTTNVPGLCELEASGVVELFLPKPFDPDDVRAYVLGPGARP